MRKGELIAFFILLIAGAFFLFPSMISADFAKGNQSHSIQIKYAPNEILQGWINISIDNEPVNSLLKTNFGGSIKIVDFLKLNSANYKCSTSDCGDDYLASGSGENIKTFTLNAGEKKVFGFKLAGDIDKINTINFDIESNAASSFVNQLEVDFLNDGIIDFINNKSGTNIHTPNYGCYSSTNPVLGSLTSEPYCQKITLPQEPSVIVGIWIKNETTGEGGIVTMDLYKGENFIGECDLTSKVPSASEEGKEVSCEINKMISEAGNYYVCASSDNRGSYKIRASTNNKCGFKGTPLQTELASYQIFTQDRSFADFEMLSIKDNLPLGSEFFHELAEEYFREKYGSPIECSEGGCVFPISIKSNVNNQQITLKNLAINHDTNILTGEIETRFYNLNSTSAKVSAGMQKLYLNKTNFTAPSDFGKKTLTLTLENSKIFDKEIEIEKIPQIISLNPLIAMAAYPTEFTAKIETFNSSNITGYDWDFGDGTKTTTKENKAEHTYDSIGYFDLKVSVINKAGVGSSKTFNISVQTPKDAIDNVLGYKFGNFNGIKTQIEKFPSFEQNSIKAVLGFDEIDKQISDIQQRNKTASSDNDYVKIMADLIKLNIPSSIKTTKNTTSVSFYPESGDINLEILKTIGGGDYSSGDEGKYKQAVLDWNVDNAEMKISFKELSAVYESNAEKILGIFEIDINGKDSRENSYLIIKKLDDLTFKDSSSIEEKEGYVFTEITSGGKTLEFTTTEDYDFSNIPAFVSPSLNELSVDSGEVGEEKRISKWIWMALIIVSLAFFGIVLYIIMQEWYKRKYESYLFKNRNDLYNLISYIEGMKINGMESGEIASKLRRSGWSSEQVRYVIRKYAGKKTGMLEIPIDKFFNLFKSKDKTEPRNFQGKHHY